MSEELDQLTRIETIVGIHTEMLKDLTTAIQGDGDKPGFKGKLLVLIETTRWHTWGLRGIYGCFILGLAGYIVKHTLF